MMKTILALTSAATLTLALLALTDNLEAFWELDNVNDSHSSNTLTNNGTVTFVTGKVGNAADFVPASSQYLSRADNAALSAGDTDMTIQAWVKFDSFDSSPTIICKCDTGGFGGDLEYAIYTTDTGELRSRRYNGSTFNTITSSGNLSLSTWYHVVTTYDASANVHALIINDGTPITASYSPGSWDTGNSFTIGIDSTSQGHWMDGLVDQVGIWRRVLSSSEITELYNSGNGRSYSYMSGGGGGGGTPCLLTLLGVGRCAGN